MGWGEYRPPVRPEVRSERFVQVVDGHRYEGVQLTHDGPCVFVDHRCSCGRLDIGIVRDERAHRVIVDEPAWCQRCQLPIPTEATSNPPETPLPAVRVECLADHPPFTAWERLSRWWRDRIHRSRHLVADQP